MKKAILDTSFILTCVKQKIDFFEELILKGFQILIPEQVIEEIKGISKSKKINERENANLALKLIKNSPFKKIDLEIKNVDKGIIKFADENIETIVGTLDKEIKRKTENQKLVIRGQRKLEIV